MHLRIETELEEDGRWIAEVPQLPGVLVYGSSEEEAAANAEILALRALAEQLEHGETKPVEVRTDQPGRTAWARSQTCRS
jgi:predicted RNase H-like HicB family nuclease